MTNPPKVSEPDIAGPTPRTRALQERMATEGRTAWESSCEYRELAYTLEREIAALAARPADGWVSVKDRLPEKGEWCLVAFDPKQMEEVGWLQRACFARFIALTDTGETLWDDCGPAEDDIPVTHWMPSPPLPWKGQNITHRSLT